MRGQRGEKPGEIGKVGRSEQNLGRAPDAKPGLLADRRVRGQAAAYRRELRNQRVHATRLGDCSAARSAGKVLAQPVVEPAPRDTTMSPGRAISRIIGASSPGSAKGRTLRWPCSTRPATRATRLIPPSRAPPAAEKSATQ